MDLQTLSHLFTTTFNPDPNVRKAAELQIRKVRKGFLALLDISQSSSSYLLLSLMLNATFTHSFFV